MKPRNSFAVVVLVAVIAAACGGDDARGDGVASIDDLATETTLGPAKAAEESAGDGEPANDEDKVLEFAACMREGGIDFPDPVVDSEGNVGFDLMAMRTLADVEQEDMEAAFEPCAQYLEGVSFGFERVFDAEFQDQIVVFAGCMRENGIDMPDPDFSGIMEGEPLFPGWEPELDDPDFEAAFEACEELLPGIPGIADGG